MKSQALQELVREIFTDEKIRAQFVSNPDSLLSQFSLTEDEKKAVLKTQARLGQMTSPSAQLEATIDPYNTWF
jgi:hypothetical protein